MHPNKPYWIAVFVSVGCLRTSFLPRSLLTAHSTHLQPHACCCHRVDVEPPTFVSRLLYPPSLNPNTSKRIRQFLKNVKTFKHDSREFLDRANAFYLTVPSRLGTLKSPNILKKTQADLTRVTSLESSNLPMCLPIWGLVFLSFFSINGG